MEQPIDVERLVREYMARFYKTYKIPRYDIEDIEQWCNDNLGKQYRDWTLYKGHPRDPYCSLSIIDPKWCTIFELKFSKDILGTIDRKPDR